MKDILILIYIWWFAYHRIALFTVTFSHLHYNVFEHGCEAISGNVALLTRNCLTSTFKNIVMQMEKVTVKRAIITNWCTFEARSHSSRQKTEKWREKVFCSSISTKELLIVSRKVDNTSFFAGLLRNLGQLSSQTGYKVTMSGTVLLNSDSWLLLWNTVYNVRLVELISGACGQSPPA